MEDHISTILQSLHTNINHLERIIHLSGIRTTYTIKEQVNLLRDLFVCLVHSNPGIEDEDAINLYNFTDPPVVEYSEEIQRLTGIDFPTLQVELKPEEKLKFTLIIITCCKVNDDFNDHIFELHYLLSPDTDPTQLQTIKCKDQKDVYHVLVSLLHPSLSPPPYIEPPVSDDEEI